MRLKTCVLLLSACWALTGWGQAPSSRPGWGSTPYSGGVTFRVWAPNATSVYVPGQFNSWSTTNTALGMELTNGVFDGVWSADVAGVVTNDQYKYYINYSGGFAWKHDPQSRWVTSPGTADGANDIVYNPTAFNWKGDSLTPPALNDLFIYEMHAGTFPASSTPSRFVAATNKLDYLKSLGVNAVEVMPIMEFGNSGSSWGYDPAQIFAVDNSQYGGPDAFKTFVQACHLRGIAVLLDVVHNHYGPNDLDMWDFDGWAGPGSLGGGIYFNQTNTALQITPWGNTRPNFNSPQVADFVQSNIVMWLSECHVDGFRWDAASAIITDNNGNYIPAGGNLLNGINAITHNNYTGKISIAEDVYDAFGFDSAWDTRYPYTFTPVLTNTVDADRNMSLIANAIQYNVRYGGNASSARVVFLESHDVVGDLNDGVRLVTAIDPAAPSSYRARKLSTLGSAVTLTAPGVPMIFQGQEMLENNAFDSGLNVDWTKTNTYSYIVQFYRDLIGARRDLKGYTPGLEGDQCSVFNVDNVNKVVAFRRWKSADPVEDAVVVANFTGTTLSNYSLSFPYAGNWYVHLNSDSTNYGPDYGNIGSSVVTASGSAPAANITIGPYSALILSQVAPTNLVTPAFSDLTASQSIGYGTPSLTLGGRLSASGPFYPAIGETITVTIDGNAQTTTINDSSGDFSINYNPSMIPASGTAYAISYAYSGDTSLTSVTNTATSLAVNPATPTLTGPTAGPIAFGQTLAAAALDDGAATNANNDLSVAGTFAFATPAIAPSAGTTNVSVTFTPGDLTDYTTASTTVNVTVNPTTPTLAAPTASAITLGQTLMNSTLSGGSATNPYNNASVAGSFVFTTPALAPNPGVTNVDVTFTPEDMTDYTSASTTVNVMVNHTTPTLTITHTGNVLTVSWPGTASGWLLESTPSLIGSPPPWSQVSAAQYQTNAGLLFINVTSPPGSVFYQLQEP